MEKETATTPTTLSPATQAVLDAFLANWADDPLAQDVLCLATALRAAAADQSENFYDPHEGKVSAIRTDWILAIAAELEGAN